MGTARHTLYETGSRMPSSCKTMKLIAGGRSPEHPKRSIVPPQPRRLECMPLVVAGGRGGRWLMSEKMRGAGNAEVDFRTGFLAVFQPQSSARRSRQETARFPRGWVAAGSPPLRSSSHAFCVGTIDLASVSPIERSVSNNLRRRHPIVSANLRRKWPLIARRAVHHCAPLHIQGPWVGGIGGNVARRGVHEDNPVR